jgi:hypothetical protein
VPRPTVNVSEGFFTVGWGAVNSSRLIPVDIFAEYLEVRCSVWSPTLSCRSPTRSLSLACVAGCHNASLSRSVSLLLCLC